MRRFLRRFKWFFYLEAQIELGWEKRQWLAFGRCQAASGWHDQRCTKPLGHVGSHHDSEWLVDAARHRLRSA